MKILEFLSITSIGYPSELESSCSSISVLWLSLVYISFRSLNMYLSPCHRPTISTARCGNTINKTCFPVIQQGGLYHSRTAHLPGLPAGLAGSDERLGEVSLEPGEARRGRLLHLLRGRAPLHNGAVEPATAVAVIQHRHRSAASAPGGTATTTASQTDALGNQGDGTVVR